MTKLALAADFALDTERFENEGLRIGVYASPGAGKGYLLGVLLEELIDAGYPAVMVDPESELWTFREIGALVVGGPHGHVPFAVEADAVIEEALRFCLDSGTPVVFDLGAYDDETEIRAGFEAIAQPYWRLVSAARSPSVFAITEAHVIAPQTMQRGESTSRTLPAILARGRKRGVIPLLETQRIADIANAVIGHCNVRFVGRIDFEDDYKRVAKGMPRAVTVADVQNLEPGTFYVPRLADEPIHVRARRVTHGAVTPGSGEVVLRREDAPGAVAKIAERLAALAEAAPAPKPPGKPEKARSSEGADTAAIGRERDAAVRKADRLQRELDEHRQRAETAEARARDADALADRIASLRAAFADLLQLGAASESGGPAYPGDEHVVRLIRANAPAGSGAPLLQPVEKLRADYLERSAQRLVAIVAGLEADERDALLFLLTRDTFVTVNAIALALSGSDSGGVRDRWAKATKTLAAKGLVLLGGTGRVGRRADVEGFIARGLAPHVPSPEESAAVRDRALSVLQDDAPRKLAAAS